MNLIGEWPAKHLFHGQNTQHTKTKKWREARKPFVTLKNKWKQSKAKEYQDILNFHVIL